MVSINIRVDLTCPIKDGTDVIFRSPEDCSQVTGLKVYSPKNGSIVCNHFEFADAHGNNVGDIQNLFAENVIVKVILDITTSKAFVQNADTNTYLEGRFKQLEDNVSNAVGNTDYATYEKAGIVQIYPNAGLDCDAGGTIAIDPATLGGIDSKESRYNPIVPLTLDYAVRSALIAPKNANWTEMDKLQAQHTLGISQTYVRKTEFATTDEPGIVRIASSGGLKILAGSSTTTPSIAINAAGLSSIAARANASAPIVPNTVDYAVRAALTDPKNVTWSEENKKAARNTLGAISADDIDNGVIREDVLKSLPVYYGEEAELYEGEVENL